MPIINTDDLLSIKHFATKLKGRKGIGVTTQRVYKMIELKQLLPIEIDGIKFLTKSDLDTLNKK